MDRVTIVCFLASYAVALMLDLWHQFRPRPVLRILSLGFGIAGLLAQTTFLGVQRLALSGQYGWMHTLAWVLAIFYLFGSLHHARIAWGVFVLPLVLLLGGLAALFEQPSRDAAIRADRLLSFQTAHKGLLLLAAVGLCVGFLASLMYLIQTHRLRAKTLPGKGWRLLSLERLEMMNRRAITLSFPLLTLGMLIGAILMLREQVVGWTDPRVLSSMILWLTFASLLYLRLSHHLRGRRVAFMTIITFMLLLACLTLSHPLGEGVGR